MVPVWRDFFFVILLDIRFIIAKSKINRDAESHTDFIDLYNYKE